jgi:hypothetical protein
MKRLRAILVGWGLIRQGPRRETRRKVMTRRVPRSRSFKTSIAHKE